MKDELKRWAAHVARDVMAMAVVVALGLRETWHEVREDWRRLRKDGVL